MKLIHTYSKDSNPRTLSAVNLEFNSIHTSAAGTNPGWRAMPNFLFVGGMYGGDGFDSVPHDL